MSRILLCGLTLAAASLAWINESYAGITLTANTAGSETSTVSKVTTENFDSFKAGSYTSLSTAVGTLSSPGLEINAADQFGGAGFTGKYVVVGSQSGQLSMTLTLKSPEAYFGMWWSAADSQNVIQFYAGNHLIGSLNSSTALGALDSSYLGNPSDNKADGNEKFAYLNFFGTGGTTFDKIVFSNLSLSTGFESDNWSVTTTPTTPTGTPLVGFTTAVPEPASLLLTGLGLASISLATRRRLTSPSSPGLP